MCIEQVIDSNTVITSESGWNYTTAPVVTTHTRYRVNGIWQYRSGYTYQGIIYPPTVQMSEELLIALLANTDDFIPQMK